MDLKRTPLFDIHQQLNAKLVPFGGWEMPLQYDTVLNEYAFNRQRASLFDCSHMGEFIITGDVVKLGFDRLVTQNLTDMPVKTCRYGAMLNEKAGVIDDLIVYRLEKNKWMAVVNAANINKDREHILAHLADPNALKDISDDIVKLDVQGPLSRAVLLDLIPEIEKLEYYAFDHFDILGEQVLVSRTGYTGELGFELYCSKNIAVELWDKILEDEHIKPTGLAIRDVLRTEMCYSLYGHELSDSINPLEAGLKPFIDFDKDFIGKEPLEKVKEQGTCHKVVYVQSLSRRAPREGYYLYNDQQIKVGRITSGTFSPGLGVGVGIGFINPEYAQADAKVFFGNDKIKQEAILVKRPFYKNGSLKD